MILKDRMRLQMLLIELSRMGSIFIEIFDVKFLNAIYSMVYIYTSRQYGNFLTVLDSRFFFEISCFYNCFFAILKK